MKHFFLFASYNEKTPDKFRKEKAEKLHTCIKRKTGQNTVKEIFKIILKNTMETTNILKTTKVKEQSKRL